MDASLWVALLDLLWLVMLAFAWLKDKQNHIRIHEAQRKWLENLSERLGGLEGRIEDAQKTHEQDAVIVNGWAEEIEALKKEMDGIRMVNDEEHRVLRDVMLALNKHGHGCVVGLEAELSRKKEVQGE